MLEHKGGCLCGCIRYIVSGEPEIAAVCHCRYCQLRSGSAFGSLAYFKDENFKIISGELKKFNFTSESGNEWETYFCDQCGTTIYCLLEIRLGLSGICSGTFDPPTFWFNLDREVFKRSKAQFVGDITANDSHETMASYSPKFEDDVQKQGG
jgi:hypothetical protein|tara:strand:+ start:149 stop:604 length:456 start_codon:yes stop_codon:yes gene_type:complete